MSLLSALIVAALSLTAPAWAAEPVPLDARLSVGLDYPHPVAIHRLTWQGQDVELAYMDIAPVGSPSGTTVLLLHGKNFSGAYWAETIARLTAVGHRVIVPDQIGFGRSSKPVDVQYSFHAMVTHTTSLLDALQVGQVAVVGHSMGGMVAARFALMQPQRTARLVADEPHRPRRLAAAHPIPHDGRLAGPQPQQQPRRGQGVHAARLLRWSVEHGV